MMKCRSFNRCRRRGRSRTMQASSMLILAAAFSSYVCIVGGLANSSKTITASVVPVTTASSSLQVQKQQEPNATCNEKWLDGWKKRWDTGNTRWHKSDYHRSLVKYFDEYLVNGERFPIGGARILVPLCGKTLDMKHMAQKRKVSQVVGVDAIPQAIETFAKENPDLEIEPTNTEESSAFATYEGNSIKLLQGDFFELDANDIGGKVDAVWDRAAMVAIRPSLREAYVQQMNKLVEKPGAILLSTLVRPNNDTTSGPPFSIDETEVRRLYEKQPWVESVQFLESFPASEGEPWYKALKLYFRLGNVQENIFLITTKEEEKVEELTSHIDEEARTSQE